MKLNLIPPKIKSGSHIRVIAPSRSLSIVSKECIDFATKKLNNLGFKVSFGKHVYEIDEFKSSSVKSRLSDLHEAYEDKEVDIILTAIGGYNANQLLDHINYDLIRNNPKILCGFSDVTVLLNSITQTTGIISYLGPHFSSWGMKYGLEFTESNFLQCLQRLDDLVLQTSDNWSDDEWFIDQEKREFIDNPGLWVINQGEAEGVLIGGHARCFSALQGTNYWPKTDDFILLLEEDAETNPAIFDRLLQSYIQQKDFKAKAILIGRFQKGSGMTKDLLSKIVKSKSELDNIPVVGNLDFGHTTPIYTLPIGGIMKLSASETSIYLTILRY